MTSPNRPPRAMNVLTEPVAISSWNGSRARAARLKPAALKAPDQIGMRPPLRMTASAFRPMPTEATWSPGTCQFPHSQAKSRR